MMINLESIVLISIVPLADLSYPDGYTLKSYFNTTASEFIIVPLGSDKIPPFVVSSNVMDDLTDISSKWIDLQGDGIKLLIIGIDPYQDGTEKLIEALRNISEYALAEIIENALFQNSPLFNDYKYRLDDLEIQFKERTPEGVEEATKMYSEALQQLCSELDYSKSKIKDSEVELQEEISVYKEELINTKQELDRAKQELKELKESSLRTLDWMRKELKDLKDTMVKTVDPIF